MTRHAGQVVGLGQCSLDLLGRLDHYPALDQKAELDDFLVQGGGPVATALVTLARLGVPVAMIGRTGDDAFGGWIRQGLLDEGVDCRGLGVDPGRTSQVAFIGVDAEGHRNIFWHRGSARPADLSPIDLSQIAAAKFLHLDGLHQEAAIAAARIAREHGVVTVLDAGTRRPGIERLLPLVDHLVVSERFARQTVQGGDPADALEPLLETGAAAVTVTLGRHGSLTRRHSGDAFAQPAFPVEAVDTTGCGDVFHGGYIYGLLQHWPLPRTVRFAAACAALKTRRLGGRTAIASLPEVEAFLERNPSIKAEPL